ncbi:MAG: thiamine-phosphate kinase [Planctomycetes bacterium]|nr:thiamine-phosphate kinase [Planctomycetota bacterium]
MREQALLRHIYDRSAPLAGFPGIVQGPGDDCAVVNIQSPVLLKVDQVIEGRHFVEGTLLDLVARKAMARPLSDIAAMAGRPAYALAAAILPMGFPQARADELFDALSRWALHWGCPLVGGDIAVAHGVLALSISIVGHVHPTRGPVYRHGAVAGDEVFVTGALGGSLDAVTGMGKHLSFEPRLAEGAWLAETLGARLHAMMDISDGLGIDAGRLAERSGVGIQIDAGSVPLSHGVASVDHAVRDGEDYELLFTVSPGALPARGECPGGCAFTRVGKVLAGHGASLKKGDALEDITGAGFEHRG